MNSIDERDARAAWSVIAEPTDAIARALWSVCGPTEALVLADRGREKEVAEALHEARLRGIPDEIAVVAAHEKADGSGRNNLQELSRRALERWTQRLGTEAFSIVDESIERGIHPVIPGDTAWPEGCDDLGVNAPVCLWRRGVGRKEKPLVPETTLALVGSRAATSYGCEAAADLAVYLAERGVLVLSGGAYGIDAAAHKGALSAGSGSRAGSTVAVLAGGLDELYPRGNADLLTRIMNEGMLFSEAPLGVRPTRWRFLARNRLIAAMSGATIVVEAAWRSGALSTAAHAESLSRYVGAVPGSVYSAASGGCHRLVRERGAVLITGGEDARELLGHSTGVIFDDEPGALPFDDADLLSPHERLVFDGIPPKSAISVEALARECAMRPADVTKALTRIELLGLAHRSGTRVRRAA